MPSIGPQLPPHLQKRKRTPEDDANHTAPPTKATRRANNDEIALDSDSSDDDSYGPRAPGPARSKPTIGPSLPPSAAARPSQPIGPSRPPPSNNNDEIALSSDDDDTGPRPPRTMGPSLPRTIGPSPPPTIGPSAPPPAAAPRRILGPAPPPASLSERPTHPPSDSDSDSDSSDGYGPALPTSAPSTSHTAAPPTRRPPSPPSAPKRDDWMLAPPTAPSSRTAPDPTKLKSRKFASSSKPPPSSNGPGGISSIWTETPEEKARRLANAVLGREDPSTSANAAVSGVAAGGMVAFRRTAADEEKIRAYAEQTRGRSLVEEFRELKEGKGAKGEEGGGKDKGKKGEDDDDDPSKRAFDWEKDMKVGGQISNSQRQQLLNRAANFGGRFQKGSFL
ncbi:GPALPP motifs-containing protein 1 [Podospora conica]|nr:GPALPP motifs-containing protein 1 [Schizothecium conicum]